jgi:peptidoglycan/LPS O-acetylase OafA/YrhL
LLFTLFLASWLLTFEYWLDFKAQFYAAITFTANLVLPTQVGYFASAAESMPLLHIWSLSLEEQYYFLVPLVLFIIPKRFRLFSIFTLFLCSISLCIYWTMIDDNQYFTFFKDLPFLWRYQDISKSELAFYLLPTRAWELLVGSIGAIVVHRRQRVFIFPVAISYILVLVLCFFSLFNINQFHPNIEAFVVVVATVLLLISSGEWFKLNFYTRCFEKVGDWSYSIYLVHWPLFAFANIVYVGQIPMITKVSLLVLSIVFGYMQFRFVETPFRTGALKDKFGQVPLVILFSVFVFMSPNLISYVFPKQESANEYRNPNYGLSEVCGNSFDKEGKLKPECYQSEQPNTVVWGDSYAMHLVPGLLQYNSNMAQITKNTCGPIIGLAPIFSKYNEKWADGCVEFNDRAFHYIKSTPSIKHVILSSQFTYYFNKKSHLLTPDGIQSPNKQGVIDLLKQTVEKLNELGVTVTIISPPPRTGFNIGECLERKRASKMILRDGCNIGINEFKMHQRAVLELMNQISSVAKIIKLSDFMCNSKLCIVEKNGIPLYRDEGHLSIEGSVEVFKMIPENILIRITNEN